MSSHHIVRENQEPALFIQDPDALAFEKIQELLEWSPAIFVPMRHAPNIIAFGIKFDGVLVHTRDTERARIELSEQLPLKIIPVISQQAEMATLAAFLKAAGYSGVYAVSNDTTLFDFPDWPPDFDLEIFQGGKRWIYVAAGGFEKWYPAGTLLWIRDASGTRNQSITTDGTIAIQQHHVFWVGETWDD